MKISVGCCEEIKLGSGHYDLVTREEGELEESGYQVSAKQQSARSKAVVILSSTRHAAKTSAVDADLRAALIAEYQGLFLLLSVSVF